MGEHSMNSPKLTSKREVVADLAKVFRDSPQCQISIREDTAFQAQEFMSLGAIKLFPRQSNRDLARIEEAVHLGMFEWQTPEGEDALREIKRCVEAPDGDDKQDRDLRRVLGLFGPIAIRTHLNHPIFDANAVQSMPFSTPTTLVCDTSGILHGAADFVAAYLAPAARIKIPGVVHMELVNMADRFLKLMRHRRKAKKAIPLLLEHFRSQIGLRVLLQLELHTDVEIEHPHLLGDPLRSAFQNESEQELRELNLSVPITSYVDRLILETARQHQLQTPPSHQLMLLTSDQGLAKMALAEGIRPLHFRSTQSKTFFGNHFSGVTFHPFTGDLCRTSIPSVLWDLTTLAGMARIESLEGPKRRLDFWAMRSDLVWSTQHLYQDLLWAEFIDRTSTSFPTRAGVQEQQSQADNKADGAGDRQDSDHSKSRLDPATTDRLSPTKLRLLSFRVDRMIALIDSLETHQTLGIEKVLSVLALTREARAQEYLRFLKSGNAALERDSSWAATPVLRLIAVAVRSGDMQELRENLLAIPVFRALAAQLTAHDIGSALPLHRFGRAQGTYSALAEITGLGVRVHGKGFYSTPTTLGIGEFCEIAIKAYEKLRLESDWIATGQWFEQLVLENGIHPVTARRQLQVCSETGLVNRMTEGSTPQTAYDRHKLRILNVVDGVPCVETVYLYRGDFLIPGTASSSLKLEGIQS